MSRRTNWIFAIMLVSVLLLPGMVLAQTDDDARQTVLDALQAINALDGYHLKLKSNYLSKIIQADGFTTNVYIIQNIDGDIRKNGDRHFTREIQTAENFEEAATIEPLLIEQILSDGSVYVNFHTKDTIYENMVKIRPGWWEYNYLVDSLTGSTMVYGVQPYAKADTPLDTIFREDIILAVIEVEPVSSNGVDLRVFDIQMDMLKLLLEQRSIANGDREETIAQSRELFAASEISLTYRLWIGEADGLIYRGKGEQRLFIPYSTAGSANDPDFDLDNSETTEFTISQHGEAVEITPPDPASLNE